MSIKDLEIRTSIVSKLVFPNKTILLCFPFILWIIDLYFLIPAVIAQIFNPSAELVMPTGTQTNDANAAIATQPVIVEAKISNFGRLGSKIT